MPISKSVSPSSVEEGTTEYVHVTIETIFGDSGKNWREMYIAMYG